VCLVVHFDWHVFVVNWVVVRGGRNPNAVVDNGDAAGAITFLKASSRPFYPFPSYAKWEILIHLAGSGSSYAMALSPP
jgi:hypothetical protein